MRNDIQQHRTFNPLVRGSSPLRPTRNEEGVSGIYKPEPLSSPETKSPQIALNWNYLYANRNQLQGRWQRVVCMGCGESFTVRTAEIKRGQGKFCTVGCGVRYNVLLRTPGKSRSQIHDRARKVYIANYGEPVCQKCGKSPADVHHINEDKTDNRIENLTAWCRSCHVSHHNSVSPKRKKEKKRGALCA